MVYLFANKWKRPSGWLFWIMAILGLIYAFDWEWGADNLPFLEIQVPYFFGGPIELAFSSDEGHKLFYANHILDEIVLIALVASGIIHGFSREKVEDELISKIRLESLAWSVFWNFGLLLLAVFFVYGMPFLVVMSIQMVSILVWFNLRYAYRLRKHYNTLENDE